MTRAGKRLGDPGGRYVLERLVGRGGTAAVYRARDTQDATTVAVKVIPTESLADAGARERFERDAQDLRRLDHPMIVRALDHGYLRDGGAFVVMEFVGGEDLRQVLRRERRLDPAAVLRILAPVCAGVDAAHRAGVVHGDLKPENIMLPGMGPAARVLDFGGARRVSADGSMLGTPAYMAPEQLRGDPPSARADIFSLGAVAFEMLTGSLPFGRGSAGEVVLSQAGGLPDLATPGLNPCLRRAVRCALEFDPDRRPPTASAFAQLLESTR